MVFAIADRNFGIADMNSDIPEIIYVNPSIPRDKVGKGNIQK